VQAATQFPAVVEWKRAADAPQLLCSTALNARNENGSLRHISVRSYDSGVGGLIRYTGGPLKLQIGFEIGHLAPKPALYVGLQRLGEGTAYDTDPFSGLWLSHLGRGANDRPSITWYCSGRTRGAGRGVSASKQEEWPTKPGDRAVLHLEYQPGLNRAWAEVRSTSGELLLRLPPTQLLAPLEHGVYLAGIPGVRNDWNGRWDKLGFHTMGVLHSVRVAGGSGLTTAEFEPTTPRLALHLANGALLQQNLRRALDLYDTVDRLVTPATAGGPGHRMDAAVGRALALLRSGRPEEARRAIQAALTHDGERLRRLLTPPYMLAMAQEEFNFFRAVMGE